MPHGHRVGALVLPFFIEAFYGNQPTGRQERQVPFLCLCETKVWGHGLLTRGPQVAGRRGNKMWREECGRSPARQLLLIDHLFTVGSLESLGGQARLRGQGKQPCTGQVRCAVSLLS